MLPAVRWAEWDNRASERGAAPSVTASTTPTPVPGTIAAWERPYTWNRNRAIHCAKADRGSTMDAASNLTESEGFQSGGRAWDPMRPDVIPLLASSQVVNLQPIYYGSNHCFLVTLENESAGRSLAVYKPARGEYPLYDFPSGTLYRREVASWLLNDLLGWKLVPPTVVGNGVYGAGSLQLFIESYPEAEIEVKELQRLTLLDVLFNNADRKSEHLLLGQAGKLWGIDHGLTFHVHPKLRTVLWHFAGSTIPGEQLSDLEQLLHVARRARAAQVVQIREHVSVMEWRALLQRLERLVQSGRFPDPRHKSIPYRW